MTLLAVFLGGGLGAVLRYWMTGAIYRYTGGGFPTGTLVVNIAGSFAIGLLMALFMDRFITTPTMRIFLTVGLLGGFTTFSTFSYEAVVLMQEGSFFLFGTYAILTVIGCLLAAWLGLTVGKLV